MVAGQRFFGPWDARQQGARTLVYSVDDIIREVTAAAVNGKNALNLVLGSNIVMPVGITIAALLPSFSLDGGGYKIVATGTIGTLFSCRTASVFTNITIFVAAGASITTLFEAPNGGAVDVLLGIGNLVILAAAGVAAAALTNILGASATFAVARVSGVYAHCGVNLFREDTGSSWVSSTFEDFLGVALTIGVGANSPKFSRCRFDGFGDVGGFTNVAGIFINANGARNTFARMTSGSVQNPGSGGNVFVGFAAVPATLVLSTLDAWTSRVAPSAAALNSAAPTLTPTAVDDMIRVTHGASASGVVTIAAGRDGQRLTLYFVAVAGTAVYTDGSGNLELASNFTPTAADTLSLIYDAATTKWVEVSRSVN